MRSRPFPSARGFALLEVWIALTVLAILLASLALPLAAQVQARRMDETRRLLEEARDALLGFAAAHGRLPCPASPTSRGAESFAAGGDASNGNCSHFHDGFLPGAALGMAPLDGEGFVRDPWTSEANRVRYAVFGAGDSVNGVTNPFTRTDGLRTATLPGVGAAPHFLFICASGAQASATGCGPAARQLTRKAAFVLLSLGPNATLAPAPGSDEARNLDGDPVFVWHEATVAQGREFDDVLLWMPVHLVTHRLIVAGRLP